MDFHQQLIHQSIMRTLCVDIVLSHYPYFCKCTNVLVLWFLYIFPLPIRWPLPFVHFLFTFSVVENERVLSPESWKCMWNTARFIQLTRAFGINRKAGGHTISVIKTVSQEHQFVENECCCLCTVDISNANLQTKYVVIIRGAVIGLCMAVSTASLA